MLLEQNDFASSSAYNLKLQTELNAQPPSDVKQARLNSNEASILMRIAPHLARPTPVVKPLYKQDASQHKFLGLGLAMSLQELLGADLESAARQRKLTSKKRVLSKRECLEFLPNLPQQGLVGGMSFYDLGVDNPERLALGFLKSAAQIGGDLANYAQVVGFMRERGRVIGVKVRDQLTSQYFEVQAKTIIISAGIWTAKLQRLLLGEEAREPQRFIKATHLITRPIFETYTVSLQGYQRDQAYSFAPLHDHTIISTKHTLYEGEAQIPEISQQEIDRLLQEINQIYPPAQLTRSDVTSVWSRLIPLADQVSESRALALGDQAKATQIQPNYIDGVVIAQCVSPRMIRQNAVSTLDQVFRLWGHKPIESFSAMTPLRGGEVQNFEDFIDCELAANPWKLRHEMLIQVIHNYGTDYARVLEYLPKRRLGASLEEETKAVLYAQIYHAIHKEMALKLTDIVFRRTALGVTEQPSADILKFCAQTMGRILNWRDSQIEQAIYEVNAAFSWKIEKVSSQSGF